MRFAIIQVCVARKGRVARSDPTAATATPVTTACAAHRDVPAPLAMSEIPDCPDFRVSPVRKVIQVCLDLLVVRVIRV